MVKLAARNQVLVEIPYYVEQSLVEVKPKRVRVGETFTDTDQRRRLDRVGQYSRRDLRQRSHRLRLRF